jgi:hypothetical protein
MHPTQQDLESGAKAVTYELLSLIGSLRANRWALAQRGRATAHKQGLWEVLTNSTQEAFLLHYRNLKQFLNNENRRYADDVKATHYSDSWPSTSNVVGEPDEDDRLNKRLAHVSYTRDSLTRSWDYPCMEKRISDAFDRFLSLVKLQHRSLFDECRQALSERKAGAASRPVSNGTETVTVFSVAAFDSGFTYE